MSDLRKQFEKETGIPVREWSLEDYIEWLEGIVKDMKPYLQHKGSCELHGTFDMKTEYECTCGLDDVLEKFKEK